MASAKKAGTDRPASQDASSSGASNEGGQPSVGDNTSDTGTVVHHQPQVENQSEDNQNLTIEVDQALQAEKEEQLAASRGGDEHSGPPSSTGQGQLSTGQPGDERPSKGGHASSATPLSRSGKWRKGAVLPGQAQPHKIDSARQAWRFGGNARNGPHAGGAEQEQVTGKGRGAARGECGEGRESPACSGGRSARGSGGGAQQPRIGCGGSAGGGASSGGDEGPTTYRPTTAEPGQVLEQHITSRNPTPTGCTGSESQGRGKPTAISARQSSPRSEQG